MGSDRRSYRAPPRLVLGGVFACGILAGVALTLVIADLYIADPRPRSADGSAQAAKARSGQTEVTLGLGRKTQVGLGKALLPDAVLGIDSDAATPQAKLKRGTLSREEVWIETISELPGPRIYIVHNLLSKSEREHIKSLGTKAGLEKALIIPYGGKDLVQSTTRTNTAAWLEFNQDETIGGLEKMLAEITGTTPEHGENLQVLHYEAKQEFQEHHDYFDPATDPPENFEPGGNRLATAIIYLDNAEKGGETLFTKIDKRVKPLPGDAVLFYNLSPDGNVDVQSMHAGQQPIGGEKWVATKWIHSRQFQDLEVNEWMKNASVAGLPRSGSTQGNIKASNRPITENILRSKKTPPPKIPGGK